MDARAKIGAPSIYEAYDVALHDFSGEHPRVTYRHDGKNGEITCGFIAGCDGFHGVSRKTGHQARQELRARLSVRLARASVRHAAGLERTHLYRHDLVSRSPPCVRRRAAATTCSAASPGRRGLAG